MASEAIATNHGLAFSISPAKPKPKSKTSNEGEDDDYVLTLAPFTKAPKINFGQVKVNTLVERNLLIINPQQFEIVLKVSNQELDIDDMLIKIEKMANIDFKLKWQPDAPGNFKYTILFEVTNCARLKFIVHAYGVCLKPIAVPKPRKPMVMLQPLKRDKTKFGNEDSTSINDKTTIISNGRTSKPTSNVNTLKPLVVSNKENQATFQTVKATKKTNNFTASAHSSSSNAASSFTNVAKPLPRLTNTIITTTTFSSTTMNAVTQIKPEFLSNERKEAKKKEEWSRQFYKIDDDADDNVNENNNETLFGQQDEKTFIQNFELNNASSLIDDFRRQTQIIASPRLFKNSTKDFSCSNENLYTSNSTYDLKTPKMRRSVSNNNLTSPSYLSFVDKTVVVVASNEPHHKSDYGEEYHSPKVFSTLKKRTRFSQDENNYPDADQSRAKNSGGPVTPKLADFIQQPQIFNSEQTQKQMHKQENNMFSSTKIASTKLVDISLAFSASTVIGETSTLLTPFTAKTMRKFDHTTTSYTIDNNNEENERINERTRILTKESLIDYYLSKQQFNLLKMYVIICQKSRRMKQFRQAVKKLKIEATKHAIEAYEAAAKLLNDKIKLAEEAQQAKLAEELRQAKLAEEAKQAKLLEYVIKIQKAFRMKRFRIHFNNYKIKLNEERAKVLLHYVLICQHKWRLKIFRKRVKLLKQQQLEYQQKQLYYAILCQRSRRMQLFRRNLNKLIKEKQQKEYDLKLLNCTLMCQRTIRMKLFRRGLNKLRIERESLIKAVIICQRAIRMKFFKKHLNVLIEERKIYQANLLKKVILCQRLYRKKLFSRFLAKKIQDKQNYIKLQNQSAIKIQQQWRMYKFRKQMNFYRNSIIKIQNWIRYDMKERLNFLKLKRSVVICQREYKLRFKRRTQAAIVIQKTWKMYCCLKKFKTQRTAVLTLQKWWYHCKENRIRFLKLKRSLPLVVQKCRILINKQNQAAGIIQRTYRLYKFRREMKKYRNAAITIQNWTRSMSERYLFLRKRLAIVKIQHLYRQIYMRRRISAAIHIQQAWRIFSSKKKLKQARETYHLNSSAICIQAYWRGYRVRKQTNHILNKIRNRLSVYERLSMGGAQTLGVRIRASIRLLSEPCEIGRIITALQDLYRVTSLSPECCQTFIREGAVDILYSFIETCNRSVPHMDLIKYCLQVFINLAKYDRTVVKILKPQNSLAILTKLLQTNHSTTSSISQTYIFMNVCIIFILLAQEEHIADYLKKQDSFVSKLLGIYATLERRNELKIKKFQEKQITSTIMASREQLLNTTVSVSTINNTLPEKIKNLTVSFTFRPDWVLTKKSIIELNDSYGALEYFLNLLGVINLNTCSKTPRNLSKLSSIRENSTSKTGSLRKFKSFDDNAKTIQPKLSSASRALFNKTPQYQTNSKLIRNHKFISSNTATKSTTDLQEELGDDNLSVCSNESYRSNTSISTIKSVASFHSEAPKMNSTVMVPTNANRTFNKKFSNDNSKKY